MLRYSKDILTTFKALKMYLADRYISRYVIQKSKDQYHITRDLPV